MRHLPNFLTGLAATAFGVVLILWVIPAQTVPAIFASVPSGFYPNFTSGMLIVSGLALALSGLFSKKPKLPDIPPSGLATRFIIALVLLVAAMISTPLLGFLPTGTIICLITLLLMQEYRWLRVALICVLAPLAIWASFEILLGRPLP